MGGLLPQVPERVFLVGAEKGCSCQATAGSYPLDTWAVRLGTLLSGATAWHKALMVCFLKLELRCVLSALWQVWSSRSLGELILLGPELLQSRVLPAGPG